MSEGKGVTFCGVCIEHGIDFDPLTRSTIKHCVIGNYRYNQTNNQRLRGTHERCRDISNDNKSNNKLTNLIVSGSLTASKVCNCVIYGPSHQGNIVYAFPRSRLLL